MPKKKTNEEFINEIYNLVGNDYTFLENYVNNSTEISCKHNKCGYIWKIKPNNFISNGNRCPICNHVKSKKDKAIDKLTKMLNDDFVIIKIPNSNKDKVSLQCRKCNFIFNREFQHILSNKSNISCPKCSCNTTNGKKEYIKENLDTIINEFDNEYILTSNKQDYDNCKQLLQIKHLPCNHILELSYDSFINRHVKCKYCSNKSIGETIIEKFLIKNNYSYIYNYSIKSNKYLSNKPYDFYIEDFNLLIEFQGEQHRKKKWCMTDKDLEQRIKIDNNKKLLAKKLGYNLIILDNLRTIEQELSEEIIKFNDYRNHKS